MKKIGIIVAIELDAIKTLYPDLTEIPGPAGFAVYTAAKENCEIYVVRCGMGEIAAACGVQYLITAFGVSMIVNFGVVGGLVPGLSTRSVCLVKNVVHYKYDCSEFMPLAVGQVDGHGSIYLPTDESLLAEAAALSDLPLVTCCSGDKFVGTETEKTYLHTAFGGDICDMESAGIVLCCEANAVPCVLFKAISDGLSDGAEGFYRELQKASLLCFTIADRLIDRFAKKDTR